MRLLKDRQMEMVALATQLRAGTMTRADAYRAIKELIGEEEESRDESLARAKKTEHEMVIKSQRAAARNREKTIAELMKAARALKDHKDKHEAVCYLDQAAQCGGRKRDKDSRGSLTVKMYVQYRAETDEQFAQWLEDRGVAL